MNCRGLLALSLALACTPGAGDTDGSTSTTATTTTPTTTPTTGEPAGLQRCAARCEQEGQTCLIDGLATSFECKGGTCQPIACTSDQRCQQLAAGWGSECTVTAMCEPGEVCVGTGDLFGHCAPLEGPMFTCADLGLVPIPLPPTEGGGDVIVCADLSSTCVDGQCFNPCADDSDCPAQLGQPHCDTATGLCRCSADSECLASGKPGLVACLAGTCGCQADSDCAGGQNVDICVDGACGCSSTAICTTPVFDNVTPLCEPA